MPDLTAALPIVELTLLVAGIAATFVPLYVGLFLPLVIAGTSIPRLRILMAVSSGIVFCFFLMS